MKVNEFKLNVYSTLVKIVKDEFSTFDDGVLAVNKNGVQLSSSVFMDTFGGEEMTCSNTTLHNYQYYSVIKNDVRFFAVFYNHFNTGEGE